MGGERSEGEGTQPLHCSLQVKEEAAAVAPLLRCPLQVKEEAEVASEEGTQPLHCPLQVKEEAAAEAPVLRCLLQVREEAAGVSVEDVFFDATEGFPPVSPPGSFQDEGEEAVGTGEEEVAQVCTGMQGMTADPQRSFWGQFSQGEGAATAVPQRRRTRVPGAGTAKCGRRNF